VDGVGSLRPRFAGDPDRWHSHGRRSDPSRGTRSTQRATSIRSASPRVQRKMPRLFKRSSTISSSAGSTRRCRGSSSSTVRTKSLHASVRRVLRQAWELDDANKAEKLLRNLAQRLERDWSGVSGSILEGIDEILTVTRLRLPKELRRSLACTNIIENVMGTVRRVCWNVKRWRSASMAMRWTAAAMQEVKQRSHLGRSIRTGAPRQASVASSGSMRSKSRSSRG
jgi:hypothetical protein